ncbi:class II glutamine amidotransferase [Ilumatobacter coccineus]|uniref:Glutamine amidotransferase type-2 domain-containing protein n=1 Tax=Ilumatobacter coccineus (strain NBRC 103263 / KCTC 29153 / YM16-304) TaxID=1313172 RepID=A0A6C7ED86_ILUCY|nr:class II glutamine amidotransferase [Ilumatobacter coccineus]BAN04283.1 hypothetical protein YM304_39690 [Ilumatobacter coccineus YM16-304]
MCRVLAYIGPEIPLESLLLTPENSLINQTLDPELHPLLQLAGWGFGAWSDHLLEPEKPLLYRRPMAAFYDDNARSVIPSLQASTLLAHVRAAAYDSTTVLTDENCHPFSYEGTPWIMAQNGALPNWKVLQRDLLEHCDDRYLEQMRGTTDTEFLYVLLLSLLDGDEDDDVQRGFETMLRLILRAMKRLDRVELTKLKLALVAPNRIIGANYGSDHDGATVATADWRELREAEPGTDDHARSMLLEPMYLLTGRNFEDHENSYGVDVTPVDEAMSAIFASEPLTDDASEWSTIEFGEMVALHKTASGITKTVSTLDI